MNWDSFCLPGIIYTATFTFHERRQTRVKVRSSGRDLPHVRRPFRGRSPSIEAGGRQQRPEADNKGRRPSKLAAVGRLHQLANADCQP